MAEVATLNQVVQIGVESTPGVAVPANRRLSALSVEPDFATDFQNFRPMGYVWPSVDAQGRESTTARLSGMGTYTEIVYPFSSLLTAATITTPPGGTDSRIWTFNTAAIAADTPKTFTVQHGDPGTRTREFAHGIVTDFNMNIDRQRVEIGGTMIGRIMAMGATMTRTNEVQTVTIGGGTPTLGQFKLVYNGATTADIAFNAVAADVQAALQALSSIGGGNVTVTGGPLPGTGVIVTFTGTLAGQNVNPITTVAGTTPLDAGVVAIAQTTPGSPSGIELIPIIPAQFNVYLDSTLGALGSTKLTRCFRANISIGNRWSPIWPLDRAVSSFATTVPVEPRGQIELAVEADTTGEAMIADMRAGTSRYVRIEAVGAIIEGAIPYKFVFDCAVKANAKPSYQAIDNVWCINFPLGFFTDLDWNRALQVAITNDLTAL